MKLLSEQVGCLTIDLGVIRRNWQLIRDRVDAAVVVAAVVKANAYGLGVARVVPALYAQGCRDFYVATLAEGIELRALLSHDATIYLLAGVAESFEHECAEHSLLPVLSSRASIESWAKFCQSHKQVLPSIIKFDSGMTRLGLSIDNVKELLDDDSLCAAVGVVGFMSHLACADNEASAYNSLQLNHFKLAAELVKAKLHDIKLSLANSSGTFLADDYHFDVVRPGAALYGINPSPSTESPVANVVSLKLPVLQVKVVSADAAVGYGGEALVSSGAVLAVVQGGYADGLNRVLASRPYAFVGGVKVPLLGRVSMDSCVFDVSAVPELARGDCVDVFAAGASVSDLALSGQSLGYEVLTSLGSRYQRLYLDDE